MILGIAVSSWHCSPIGNSFQKGSENGDGRLGSNYENGYQVVDKSVLVVGNDVIAVPNPSQPKYYPLSPTEIANIKLMAKSEIKVPNEVYSAIEKKQSKLSMLLVMKETGEDLGKYDGTLQDLSVQWNGKRFSIEAASGRSAELIQNLLDSGFITAEKNSAILGSAVEPYGVKGRPNIIALRLKKGSSNSLATVWLAA